MAMETNQERNTGSDQPGEVSRAKLVVRLIIYIIILGVILFLSAGRVDWIMGWAWLGIHGVVVLISMIIVPLDPQLIEERTQIKEGVKK